MPQNSSQDEYLEIVYHPNFSLYHDLGFSHPTFESYENPLRVKSIVQYLENIGLYSRKFNKKDCNEKIVRENKIKYIKPKAVLEHDLLRVHAAHLINRVKHFSQVGTGEIGYSVIASSFAWKIAILSAGSVFQALDDVFSERVKMAFSLNRPPGHHATRDEADGLCIFNNLAIAIEKLRKEQEFNGKIAIIDIDAHYGDGLAKIYDEDPSVLYCSIHEYAFGGAEDGYFTHFGNGKGHGTTINFPIPINANDSFIRLFCEYIEPFIREYRPEIIIVPVGFDGHWSDPLGNLNFTSKGFREFTEWVKRLSKDLCNGKLVFNLEGGYNPLIMPHLFEEMICNLTGLKSKKPIDGYSFDEYAVRDKTRASTPLFQMELNRAKKNMNNILKSLNKIPKNPYMEREID